MKTLQEKVTIQTTTELAWLAWTRSDRVKQWFAPDANVQPCEGGAFELFFVPSNRDVMNTKGCKIIALDPMTHLSFTWKGPDDFAGLMNDEHSLTVVSVSFSGGEDGITVGVEHTGWGEGEEWAQAYGWHEMAWRQVLGSLKSALESGKGELCCSPDGD